MSKKETVLVTGSTGFIGGHVIKNLLNKKVKIVATSQNRNKAKKYEWFGKTEYVPLDIGRLDGSNLYDYFQKPDRLIHLSWEGLPNYREPYHFERNLPDNYTFLKNLIQNGLNDLTVVGTCFEYGLQNGRLSETYESKPVTSYGLAKDTLRNFLEQLKRQYDFKLRWVRPFYVYGDNQNENSILGQLEKAAKNRDKVFNMSLGEQLRDYLRVEKMAEYISTISLQDKIYGIINCCSGEPISVRRFAENYTKEKGIKIKLNLGYYPYPDYEPLAFWGDNTKLLKIINNNKD